MKKIFITLILVAFVATTLMVAGCINPTTAKPPQIVSLPDTTVVPTIPTIMVPVDTTVPVIYVTTAMPTSVFVDTSDPNVTSTALGTSVVIPVVNATPVVNVTPAINITPDITTLPSINVNITPVVNVSVNATPCIVCGAANTT